MSSPSSVQGRRGARAAAHADVERGSDAHADDNADVSHHHHRDQRDVDAHEIAHTRAEYDDIADDVHEHDHDDDDRDEDDDDDARMRASRSQRSSVRHAGASSSALAALQSSSAVASASVGSLAAAAKHAAHTRSAAAAAVTSSSARSSLSSAAASLLSGVAHGSPSRASRGSSSSAASASSSLLLLRSHEDDVHPHALLASPPLPPSTPPSHASGRAAASSPSAGPCASLRTERRVVMALAVASFVLALPASLVFIGAPWCPLAFAQSGQVLPVCASCAVTPLPWWAALLAVVAGVALIVDIIAAALGVRLLTMVAMMGSGLLVFVYLAAMFLFISDSPALYAASASTPDLHCRATLMAARERMHASGAMFGFVCAARGAMLALFIRLRRIDKRSPTGIATVSSPPRGGSDAADRWTLRGYAARAPPVFRSSYAEL